VARGGLAYWRNHQEPDECKLEKKRQGKSFNLHSGTLGVNLPVSLLSDNNLHYQMLATQPCMPQY